MITMGRKIVIDYQDLIDDHAEIERLSVELEEVATRDGTPAHVEQARSLLRRLARVVASHLRKEESFIYPGLSDGAETRDEAHLVHDFEQMKVDWEFYLERWQRDGALREWRRFARTTIPVLRTLRERALAEVGLLYAIGLREGLIALRLPADGNEG